MRRYISKIVLTSIICCSLGLAGLYVQAQPGKTKGPPINPDKPCKGPCNVPIDGGAGLLLAAGVLYGVKKLYGKKNGL